MRKSPRARIVFTCLGALLALQWSLTAQVPVAAKRPLTYDVVDYWKSIQGTRLADGQVKVFDKVGSFRLPEKSSTWLAYYKGVGGAGAGGGRGGGRGGAGRGGGAPPAAARGGGTGAAGRGQTANGEKRKDPGSD